MIPLPPTPLPFQGYEVILFDWDGTLVDTCPFLHKVLVCVLNRYAKPPLSLHQVQEGMHGDALVFFETLFGSDKYEALSLFHSLIREVSVKDRFSLFSFVCPLLELLKASGKKVGVVSNKTSDLLREEINKAGLFFHVIIGRGDSAEDKPSAAPIFKALSLFQYEGSLDRVLFVGDSITDEKASFHAGCHFFNVHPLLQEALHEEVNDHEGLNEEGLYA